MSTFSIKQSNVHQQYEYTDENVAVTGQIVKDGQSGEVKSITGNMTKQGSYLCNFSGSLREDSMRYSVSDVAQQDANDVWAAIAAIEQAATPDSSQSTEAPSASEAPETAEATTAEEEGGEA